ncbi:MAG: Crp/Fnr family transcriptional regulator [Acidiferrobacterales bacterium]|nr:Crp/Fnr family transcriptional regulator [Acidiferrobacterales bacterium]
MADLLGMGVPRLAELLPDTLMRRLLGLGTLVRYKDGELLHQRGEHKPGLSIVQAGQVVAGNLGSDGSFLMSSQIGPGECFGEFTLFAGLPRTHEISSVGESAVYQIPAAPFMALFDNEPDIARALLVIALVKYHALLEFVDSLRRLPLEVRVARLLLANVGDRTGRQEVKCRQEDLAFTFGVTRVSIGKVIARLQGEGLIEAGYGRIVVPDVSKLEEWVEARSLITPLEASIGT